MPGHRIPLNSGIRYPSVASVENTFLRGMQLSESSFIVTSAVSSTEDRSENHESYLLTRLIAKATRKLHRPNTWLQDAMNDVFERCGCSKPRADRRAAGAASSSEGRAA
jgi:hypothetical protein